MVTPGTDELLARCVAFHGHVCVGQALGVRLALKGMDLIATQDPREMIVLIENDRCIADAIQIVTGTRIGRRSAKLVDLGKMAATFLHVRSGEAYRVNVRRVDPQGKRGEDACRVVLRIPDMELLSWRRVRVQLTPEELPGKPKRTVECSRCGEKVFDGKDLAGAEGPCCRSCVEGTYYSLLTGDP